MNRVVSYILNFLFVVLAGGATFYQINIVPSQQETIQVKNPQTSQAFYDELQGKPKIYFIDFIEASDLDLNLSVPATGADRTISYFADIFLLSDIAESEKVASIGGSVLDWQESYDPLIREYYYRGSDLSQQLPAGKYRVEVYSTDNLGKYILQIGQEKPDDILSFLNIYWQLPFLKLTYFKTSVLQFFLTPFAIIGVGLLGILLVLLALLYYFAGVIRSLIKHQQAKTLLLTSNGMQMKEEITKLLQKPTYDITVGFITTAHKYKLEEDPEYVNRDLQIMKEEMRFNVEEIDIEGKKESEVMKLLKLKDIIFVAGGNTFYLLNAMRRCNFERVIRKLLKEGKVYVGASAGSMVAGKTIKIANWKNIDKNVVGLRNLKGLNLVPFDIFVHFRPEHAEIIRKKMPWKWQRKKLKILTDEQAILVQGKDVALIGGGEAVII